MRKTAGEVNIGPGRLRGLEGISKAVSCKAAGDLHLLEANFLSICGGGASCEASSCTNYTASLRDCRQEGGFFKFRAHGSFDVQF